VDIRIPLPYLVHGFVRPNDGGDKGKEEQGKDENLPQQGRAAIQ